MNTKTNKDAPTEKTVQNIVHEADAQRQHVRVQLPAIMLIDHKSYKIKDWSVTAAQVATLQDTDDLKTGKTYNSVMNFNLENFSITLPLTIRIEKSDSGSSLVAHYQDVSPEKASVLQQLVSAYLAGELVSAGEIIHISSRNNYTQPRQLPKKESETAQEKTSRLLKTMAVAALSLLLIIYVFFGLYERTYIVEAENAVITGNEYAVKSAFSGPVNVKNFYTGQKVAKGELLMNVVSSTGTVRSIDSPCDCIISRQLISSGATIQKEDTVMMMVPQGAALYVDAFVTYEEAINIKEGDNVQISADGESVTFEGKVADVVPNAQDSNRYRVRIISNSKIENNLIGLPAKISIDTAGWFNWSN